MWSKQDIKDLMVLSGFIGAVVGSVGIAMYVGLKELKTTPKEKKQEEKQEENQEDKQKYLQDLVRTLEAIRSNYEKEFGIVMYANGDMKKTETT